MNNEKVIQRMARSAEEKKIITDRLYELWLEYPESRLFNLMFMQFSEDGIVYCEQKGFPEKMRKMQYERENSN